MTLPSLGPSSYRYMLLVVDTIPETKHLIAVVTEPVLGSLANVTKDFTGIPPDAITDELRSASLSFFDIACGLLHSSQALSFLHREAKLLHSDLGPASIVVTQKGVWKVACLGFAVAADGRARDAHFGAPLDATGSGKDGRHYPLRPDMSTVAPERMTGDRSFTATADLWSLGVLAYELLARRTPTGTVTRLLDVSDGRSATYGHRLANLDQELQLHLLPPELQTAVGRLLDREPSMRGQAHDLERERVFQDGPIRTLRDVQTLIEQPLARQVDTLVHLVAALEPFPVDTLEHLILPVLCVLCQNDALVMHTLPCIFYISGRLPMPCPVSLESTFSHLFRLDPRRFSECRLLLLRSVPLILRLVSPAFARDHVLPVLLQTLQGEDQALASVALEQLPALTQILSAEAMNVAVLPSIQVRGMNETNTPSLSLGVPRNARRSNCYGLCVLNECLTYYCV